RMTAGGLLFDAPVARKLQGANRGHTVGVAEASATASLSAPGLGLARVRNLQGLKSVEPDFCSGEGQGGGAPTLNLATAPSHPPPRTRKKQQAVLATHGLPQPSPQSTILAQLDADQRIAASTLDGPLLIIAGPGSGKTRTLTHRIAHLVVDRGVS